MKVKAVLKGDRLYFTQRIVLKTSEVEVDVEVPDEAVQTVEPKGFSEELRSLFKKTPNAKVDWKRQWYKHLEEKYNG
ncbi:hypothetical protein BPIT_28890 [Candidatus Brocadia pituitae]|nr:hypothetical protein BPIT_28890 [Candidatus Brocadia pituitae]